MFIPGLLSIILITCTFFSRDKTLRFLAGGASLVPRPLPLIKMHAGRGSGGMTRFLTDPRRNAGAHSFAIVLSG